MAGRKQWLDRLRGVGEKLAVLPPELPADRELVQRLLGVPGRTALRILLELDAQKDDDGRLALSQAFFGQALDAPGIQESVPFCKPASAAPRIYSAYRGGFGADPTSGFR